MKRCLTIAIVFGMILSSMGICYAAVSLNINTDGTQSLTTENSTQAALFSDTQATDWYYPHMKTLVEKGGINGYVDGTFKPNNTITNAEFVKIIVGIVDGEKSNGTEHWAENYLNTAIQLGIVLADEYTVEQYDEPMKRQNMAKVVSRTADKILHEATVEGTDEYTNRITDWEDTCGVCKPDIAQAYAKGIIAGMPDGSFAGRLFATRAEASTMIVRLIDKNYRVAMYGNVSFNEITDVTEDGRMATAKSKNFMDITLETIKFTKEDGRYYVSGSFSELPEGFTNEFDVLITRKNAPLINVTTGFTTFDEDKILNTGAFKKELKGLSSISEIEYVEIFIAIKAVQHNNEIGYKYGFTGNYRITTVNSNVITYSKNNGEESETFEYDFSKIFQW